MLGMKPSIFLDKRNILPKAGTCRCLFGPVDHDEVRKTLRRELRLLSEQSNERWNFDFSSEKPLTGRYSWSPVKVTDNVPKAYLMPQLTVKVLATPISEDSSISSDISSNTTSTSTSTSSSSTTTTLTDTDSLLRPSFKTDQASQTNPEVTTSRKRKRQQNITDYFPKRKMARTCDKRLQ